MVFCRGVCLLALDYGLRWALQVFEIIFEKSGYVNSHMKLTASGMYRFEYPIPGAGNHDHCRRKLYIFGPCTCTCNKHAGKNIAQLKFFFFFFFKIYY